MEIPQSLHNKFLEQREAAALAIFDSGSVLINTKLGEGFSLKIHDTYPDAPLSPIYMALRAEGVKTGQLKAPDFDLIGQAMAGLARKENLFARPRYVAGIPAAGEPFADALNKHLEDHFKMRPFQLFKQENPRKIGGVRIGFHELNSEDMQEVILVDDLVTQAGTKLEAVDAVHNFGGHVTDLLVFLDRSGGQAAKTLADVGVTMHSAWDYDTLLEFYLGAGRMTRKEFEAIIEYPQRLQDYVDSQ